MSRPNLIARGVMLVAAALAVLVVVIVASGGSSYALKLELANASGLRPGSQVLLGGVSVGTVGSLSLDSHNVVVAELDLNKGDVRIGQGVRANIVAANLLGEVYVALSPGDQSRPLPAGTTLPVSATTVPTDLDQIVNVLDSPTRARLAVLLREAGIAVAGRRADVSAILRQFPLSLSAATQLLDTMVRDNHTLADLLSSSDGFISRINQQSSDLKQVISSSAGATTTLAIQAGNLARTVQGVDSVERTFTNFFVQITPEIYRLVPVANQLTQTAPRLNELLRAVKPFTRAAVPTLNQAAAVAPDLTRLAVRATPTVKAAVPTLASLQNLAKLGRPGSDWLGLSANDLVSIIANWSKAVQYRDGIGHVFGGEIYLDPQIVLGVANKGATAAQRAHNLLDVLNPAIVRTLGISGAQAAARKLLAGAGSVIKKVTSFPTPHPAPSSTPAGPTRKAPPATGSGAGTNPVLSPVNKGLGAVTSGLGGLLGGLVGGLTHHAATGTTGTTGPSGHAGSTSAGSGLGGLLHYLLGN
jgi:phospholipid/cholesterol/gamma-HCH transport system substrate-binding protein